VLALMASPDLRRQPLTASRLDRSSKIAGRSHQVAEGKCRKRMDDVNPEIAEEAE
jgi:hypothetical protein